MFRSSSKTPCCHVFFYLDSCIVRTYGTMKNTSSQTTNHKHSDNLRVILFQASVHHLCVLFVHDMPKLGWRDRDFGVLCVHWQALTFNASGTHEMRHCVCVVDKRVILYCICVISCFPNFDVCIHKCLGLLCFTRYRNDDNKEKSFKHAEGRIYARTRRSVIGFK